MRNCTIQYQNWAAFKTMLILSAMVLANINTSIAIGGIVMRKKTWIQYEWTYGIIGLDGTISQCIGNAKIWKFKIIAVRYIYVFTSINL